VGEIPADPRAGNLQKAFRTMPSSIFLHPAVVIDCQHYFFGIILALRKKSEFSTTKGWRQ